MTGSATPKHLAPKLNNADRPSLPALGTERETLTAFLDWHRATFELKCAGLSPDQLSRRAVPPSTMSLHGMARHLAGVERWWFRIQFAGEDVPLLYYSDDDPDQDFGTLTDAEADFSAWRTECEHSRRIIDAAPSLDATGIRKTSGEPVSLRRIIVDMLAEYARHNGHADLLRERIDGTTGM